MGGSPSLRWCLASSSQGDIAVTTSDLVGLRIKTVRRQRGLSQAQLAHPELSDSYVSLIESGKRTPTPAVLELLAQKLDCSLSYLVNGVTAEQMNDIELGLGYARLALENGEVHEARTRFAELLADNNLAGLTALRQEAEYGLALATEATGDLSQAIEILRRLDAEELSADRHVEIALALCRCHRDKGDLVAAVEVGERILSGAVRPAWTDGLVELGATLLAAYWVRGDLLRARQFSAELLAAAELLGTPRATVAASWNAARVAESVGRGEEALALVERAYAIQSETGAPRNLARLRGAVAGHHARLNPQNTDKLRELFGQTLRDVAESSAGVTDQAIAELELAKVELTAGRLELAIEHARAADGLLAAETPELDAQGRMILARAQGALGDREQGLASAREALRFMQQSPASRQAAGKWYALAETIDELGDEERAVEAYQQALACVGL
ncbi:helix-turn-helix domain-containing protein [Nonomuraea dietziae]|uniref:helix-turn-helix domain-containing protein n=1 Tax=Nonomuraea dietziae TaxID=65515 RepID=UPI001C842CC8|nr:helix-turn-helix transcriptional regulator [Nonomuraea dietziae]